MNTNVRTRVLGIAFLLQALTSIISGAVLLDPLLAPGNISDIMTNIANNPMTMRATIFGDMVTAMGIVFLGAVLFAVLRKQNERIALIALGLYVIEAAILAMSRLAAFSLLRISESFAVGSSADLSLLGTLALDTMNFGYTLHMLPFCVGAFLFYYLLFQSAAVPRPLALWGLATIPLVSIAILFTTFGYEVPFAVYLPYAPFEFVIGAWILVRGVRAVEDVPPRQGLVEAAAYS